MSGRKKKEQQNVSSLEEQNDIVKPTICLEQGDLCNCGEIMNENHYVFIFKKINTSRQKSEEQKLNLHKIYTVQYAILKKYQHLSDIRKISTNHSN